jgi:hypothetical protein
MAHDGRSFGRRDIDSRGRRPQMARMWQHGRLSQELAGDGEGEEG